MAEDTLARLRSTTRPAPGLLVHDWNDSAAVVFIPGTNTTHLIDGTTACLLADWQQPVAADEVDAVTRLLEAQMPVLLQTGILTPHKA